jgi:DNA mismatch endonuclease (patch repair protein)
MTRKWKASDRRSTKTIHGESPTSNRDDAELRSHIMRSVRQERTGPEDAVAAAMVRAGMRFRRNVRSLPGSPDLANKTRRFAIFVHGCFWHRHPGCPKATMPKTNVEFWVNKFLANVERDSRKEESLRAIGYNVQVIWECETQDAESLDRLVARLLG